MYKKIKKASVDKIKVKKDNMYKSVRKRVSTRFKSVRSMED